MLFLGSRLSSSASTGLKNFQNPRFHEGKFCFLIDTNVLPFFCGNYRNASVEIGMCPASRWQKLSKNNWGQSISPFDHRILDIRMPPDPSRTIALTTSEGTS
jgi:hypothetical protein